MDLPRFKTVRGMRDFLPKEAERMRDVEHIARELARLYHYEEIVTPVVESYDLVTAKAGEEIRHRMYAFKDLGDRMLALRPEFTASIARLVATKLKARPKPMRLFCVGSLYRYDEPQYGRYREFWQSNYELMGSSRSEADAEILLLTNDFLQKLGLRNYWFRIGHMGILRGILIQEGVDEDQQNRVMQLLDKKQWEDALTFLRETGVSVQCVKAVEELLEVKGKDVSRVLDKTIKHVEDYESSAVAVENLREIIGLTTEGGVEIDMSIEAGFARGLEYYTGMVFEPYVPELDIALGGGGRYDRLIELFGGDPTPAVGVAHGIDRLALATKRQKIHLRRTSKRRILVVPVADELRPKAMKLSLELRKENIPVEVEVMGRTVSKALQDADRRKVTHAIILGPEELREEMVVLRDMKRRTQRTVKIEDLSEEIVSGTQ